MEYYEHNLDPVGVRPEWLDDDDVCDPHWTRKPEGEWYDGWAPVKCVSGWPDIDRIRIPADHWAVPALKAGFKPWPGGAIAPDDWDGGEVMTYDRSEGKVKRYDYKWTPCTECWQHKVGFVKVIGYRPKPAEQVQPSAPALTEEMVREWFRVEPRHTNAIVDWLREHGALPADPIKAALQDKWPLLDADALRETLAKHNLKIVEA